MVMKEETEKIFIEIVSNTTLSISISVFSKSISFSIWYTAF